MFTKYEKISIYIIIAIILLFLVIHDFLIILFLPISLLFIFFEYMLILGDPDSMYFVVAMCFIVASLGVISCSIIVNRIFHEPHKIRKTLIGFIILYHLVPKVMILV